MIPTKNFTVRYYRVDAKMQGNDYDLISFFKGVESKSISARPVPLIDHGSDYQLRAVSHSNDGIVSGCFVRFREDRPIAGSRNHDIEKPVDLADDEEVLDKNHFLFFKKGAAYVLAYQSTMEGGSAQALGRYIAAIIANNIYVTVSDFVSGETLDSLIRGKRVQYVQFKVAKPTAKKYMPDPEDTWSQQAIEFMDNTGATRFEAKIVTYSQKRGLLNDVIPSIKHLMSSKQTKKLKVKVSDISEPIDLFADRIKDKISVELKSGIVVSDDVKAELWKSMTRTNSRLSDILE